jgi:hypothetical protein
MKKILFVCSLLFTIINVNAYALSNDCSVECSVYGNSESCESCHRTKLLEAQRKYMEKCAQEPEKCNFGR